MTDVLAPAATVTRTLHHFARAAAASRHIPNLGRFADRDTGRKRVSSRIAF
ncbi:hypothetical protein IFR23_05210 [Sphingomonas sp. CFBP 13603]|uniref:hypothetical protein n=1 Tax=Sphingomonas sp. CFBP 13603 TaxID=2774040 RepID=UPI001866D4DE|nr:hypothetical protein [Sphingomonas sp. CFBP 13603]MBE2991411.1 hypothetical protein [Sphingomonas sp. CFBP 13603]